MKKIIKFILIVIPLVLISFTFISCGNTTSLNTSVTLSGDYITREYTLGDATGFEINNLNLKSDARTTISFLKSDTKKISVKAQESLFDKMNLTNTNSLILVSAEKNTTYVTDYVEISVSGYQFDSLSLACATSSTAEEGTITESSAILNLSGASRLEIAKVNSLQITATVSGASALVIKDIATPILSLNTSGASTVTINAGLVTTLSMDLSGASTANFKLADTKDGSVTISGASVFYVNVSGTITGFASGASTIYKSGQGTLNIECTGASEIKTNA